MAVLKCYKIYDACSFMFEQMCAFFSRGKVSFCLADLFAGLDDKFEMGTSPVISVARRRKVAAKSSKHIVRGGRGSGQTE